MSAAVHPIYPTVSRDLVTKRRELAPGPHAAFEAFSASVFADGALDAKTKQLIAVAVAHVTQCPSCIRGYQGCAATRRHAGATDGGDLGRGGDARRRRLRALAAVALDHGRAATPSCRMSGAQVTRKASATLACGRPPQQGGEQPCMSILMRWTMRSSTRL